MIHRERLFALCRLDSVAGAAGVLGRGGRGRREWAGWRMRNLGERWAGRGSLRPLLIKIENRSSLSRASPRRSWSGERGLLRRVNPTSRPRK